MAHLPSWIQREYTCKKQLSRGARGKGARSVQEWLGLHGHSVEIDGDFGPATQAAVKKFQGARRLPVSGRVDRGTFEALAAPMMRALRPISRRGRDLNQLVVAYAEQHMAEAPREIGGQNKGPWVRLYMKGKEGDAYPWCAGFVSFVGHQAATTFDANLEIPYTYSCDVIAVEAKHRKRFVAERDLKKPTNKTELRPGSLFLNRRTSTDWVHTGIVVHFDAETFETIEGNTNDEGSREGYEVCRRLRAYKKRDFVRLD